MQAYHRTFREEAILAEGFRDTTGHYGRSEPRLWESGSRRGKVGEWKSRQPFSRKTLPILPGHTGRQPALTLADRQDAKR